MKVAIGQLTPVFLDRAATLAHVVRSVHEAADAGAALVAFGETLVPAYPAWLSAGGGARFNDPVLKGLHARYVDQAVIVEAHLGDVRAVAAERKIAVILGVAERDPKRGHSLFCSRVFIDGTGAVVSVHRKLMPTYEERLAWGIGDGAGLITHSVGPFQVGALNCWENWMPLARAALYADGEDLHVMLWPGAARLTKDLTRFVAMELRGYVVSASSYLPASALPDDVRGLMGGVETGFDGGSCIAGPDGSWVVEPVVGKETLIVADLDPMKVAEERQNFDPAGHYSRPDVLRLAVDRRRHRAAVSVEE